MSDTASSRPSTVPATWLLCADCSSTVHEVRAGEPPRMTLSIEIEHSDTCPVWTGDGREVALAFLPKEGER